MRFSNALILIFATTFFSATQSATANDEVKDQPEQADQTERIKGRIVLPAETPEWFNGGELSFKNAVLMIEGMYRGPRLTRPENYGEMTKEERQAWFAEFRKTEAYAEYRKKHEEAYKNRPIWMFPVEEDGSFSVKGLKLGRYNVIPLIPHKAAKGKEIAAQSWGAAFRQIVLSEDRQSINVGKMELKLQNVVMPGDVAPLWAAQDYKDNEIKSSDFQGKHVIVDFWATWCSPCIAEIPNLDKVYEEFGGEQLEIIGLSIDETIDLPSDFLTKRPSTYRQGFIGSKDEGEAIALAFGVQSIPAIWLIGPDGKVIARDLTGDEIGSAVRAALKDATPKQNQ